MVRGRALQFFLLAGREIIMGKSRGKEWLT